jgi:hypothetical protein
MAPLRDHRDGGCDTRAPGAADFAACVARDGIETLVRRVTAHVFHFRSIVKVLTGCAICFCHASRK